MRKLLDMSDSAKKKYAELFTKALNDMEGAEWKKPWVQPHHGMACNLYRQNKPYRGINEMILNMLCSISGYNTPYFVTMKQMDDESLKYSGLSLNKVEPKFDKDGMPMFDKDGNVRYKCEESFPVFKYLPKVFDKDGNKITLEDYDAMTEEEQEECKKFFSLFVYSVWNIDQTDFKDIYPDAYKEMTEVPEHEYETMAHDEVLERIICGGGWICPILFGGTSAHFSPREKHIRLPKRESFLGDEMFYAAALHEMAHSTKIDLKRSEEITQDITSKEKYAYEEFVAELTSACVCSMLGIGKLLDAQHLTYVESWRKALMDDKDFIVKVIDDVQKATNYILRVYEENKQAAMAMAA